jgi:hypothetical protein
LWLMIAAVQENHSSSRVSASVPVTKHNRVADAHKEEVKKNAKLEHLSHASKSSPKRLKSLSPLTKKILPTELNSKQRLPPLLNTLIRLLSTQGAFVAALVTWADKFCNVYGASCLFSW